MPSKTSLVRWNSGGSCCDGILSRSVPAPPLQLPATLPSPQILTTSAWGWSEDLGEKSELTCKWLLEKEIHYLSVTVGDKVPVLMSSAIHIQNSQGRENRVYQPKQSAATLLTGFTTTRTLQWKTTIIKWLLMQHIWEGLMTRGVVMISSSEQHPFLGTGVHTRTGALRDKLLLGPRT